LASRTGFKAPLSQRSAQSRKNGRQADSKLCLRPLGLGIGVEREWLAPWCDAIQVVTDLNHIGDTSAEMLFAR
jgi:hypothetical protein